MQGRSLSKMSCTLERKGKAEESGSWCFHAAGEELHVLAWICCSITETVFTLDCGFGSSDILAVLKGKDEQRKMAPSAPSPAQARELYRALLREARGFSNYNIREYVKRRTVAGFHDQHADPAAAYTVGKEQLELAKRQAIVYNLYVPRARSIMGLN